MKKIYYFDAATVAIIII